MQLRPHQEKAIEMCRASIKMGMNRPVIAATTSFGKTITAAQLMKNCQDKGKIGWFFCDRIKLVEQTIKTFKAMGIDFGVRQADHELRNPNSTVQICSVQTVQAMVDTHQGRLPDMDFVIVDECHIQHKLIRRIAEEFNSVPMIGLSATPYSKGLGTIYNNLIVPITAMDLLKMDYLCPVRYYGGAHVDLSKIGSSDRNSYRDKDLVEATDRDCVKLTGGIIKNWLALAEDSQTIAFSPSQDHSKFLVNEFNKAGIKAMHIDCYTDTEEREELFRGHDAGEFKILSCSRLLNTGYDAPQVRCLIDCFPTKSITTYVQRLGRIMRTSQGKDYSIYLDHAGNFEKFGRAEEVVPDALHDGESVHDERELTNETKEKKEAKSSECPQCFQMMKGVKCLSCGYVIPMSKQMEDDGTMLEEIEDTGSKANKVTSKEDKEAFLAELRLHGKSKGYKDGWASNQYREKFGVWPNKTQKVLVHAVSQETKGWLQHQNIKRAKSR